MLFAYARVIGHVSGQPLAVLFRVDLCLGAHLDRLGHAAREVSLPLAPALLLLLLLFTLLLLIPLFLGVGSRLLAELCGGMPRCYQ